MFEDTPDRYDGWPEEVPPEEQTYAPATLRGWTPAEGADQTGRDTPHDDAAPPVWHHFEISGSLANDIRTRVETMKFVPAGERVRDGIGDVTSQAKGSGARYNAGKADFSLIPMCTLEDEARVWEFGKQKYAAWNWAKGMPWSACYASMQRHLAAWQRGEDNDAESGLPHLAHAMCNLRMLTLYAKTYKEGDDRPPAELFKECSR